MEQVKAAATARLGYRGGRRAGFAAKRKARAEAHTARLNQRLKRREDRENMTGAENGARAPLAPSPMPSHVDVAE
jgi:hypothetical protein